MDKNAIKKYAIWARRELIERVAQRAAIYGITEKNHGDPDADSVNERLLSTVEKQQRKALIHKITEKGYQQVIEEVAYTWFNRFAALRFMEVNGYLPSHVRVFTNDAGEFKPQILTEAIHLELEGLNKNKVYELENENKTEELYKYLLIVQCNALNEILPSMFQKIGDYTELLLPDNLLRHGSVIEQMITMIPEEDWTDQVQIIGWLYQYYNTEPKDKVFADLKKNIKITKENIPAATQLFTPDWIVHYMVENSLGRLWLEGHPNDVLKSRWKYYLDEAEQESEVQAQLDKIRKEYATLKPEDIRVIDPCMGSGHILCVLFDVLVQIYEDYGYSAREAAVSIVEKNLWGLDIDDRAAQLSYFAVMMKARQYDRRFFSRKIQPHVYAILESNDLDPHCIEYFVDGRKELKSEMDTLVKELHNAKEYGSILNTTQVDFASLHSRFEEIQNEKESGIYSFPSIEILLPFVMVALAMTQKYHVVVTNPPYMSSGGMNDNLQKHIKKVFPDYKSDLYAVFIKVCFDKLIDKGMLGIITQHTWMFLSRYEKMRNAFKARFLNLTHLGARAFDDISGEIVQTVAFTAINDSTDNYVGSYVRLVDYNGESVKEKEFHNKYNYYFSKQSKFMKIPGSPIAYWVSDNELEAFNTGIPLKDFAIPRVGAITGNNDRFIKNWWEIAFDDICFSIQNYDESVTCNSKWFPYNKGGTAKTWYGNRELVVFFRHGGYDIVKNAKQTGCFYFLGAQDVFFKQGITWNGLASNRNTFRFSPVGTLFDSNKGPMLFPKTTEDTFYLLGLFNSKVTQKYLNILNPSISLQAGDFEKLPILIGDNREKVQLLAEECVEIAKAAWDDEEISWDFQQHPIVYFSHGLWDVTAIMCSIHSFFGRDITVNTPIEASWLLWRAECEDRFRKLKANEEELNRIFIDIYGQQNELTPDVADEDVSIRKADLQRDIQSFISYAVGCMFGRYSLDHKGLIFAGGDFNEMFSKRKEYLAEAYYNPDEPPAKEYICLKTNDGWKKQITFLPDKDNILPICDDEYFADDIVGRFVKFVEVIYGKEKLEENLRFIADALGGKGAARDVIRSYFLNDFYADHLKVYQKRPIYWLFDSGKKNGFKCLIYMHRYQPDTIARIRTDYIHEQQSRYRTAIADLEQRVNGASTSERVKLSKQLAKLQDQAEELRVYEEKIHHLADQMIKIDLDDGVKVNYAKFQDVLAPIK